MTESVDDPAAPSSLPPEDVLAASGDAAPVVAWDEAPPTSKGGGRVMDVVVWVVGLAALVILALVRAALQPDLGSAELFGYVLGAVVFALLIALAWRWLWLRFRRRTDPTAHLLSPWIPVGAVILMILSIFGGNQS